MRKNQKKGPMPHRVQYQDLEAFQAAAQIWSDADGHLKPWASIQGRVNHTLGACATMCADARLIESIVSDPAFLLASLALALETRPSGVKEEETEWAKTFFGLQIVVLYEKRQTPFGEALKQMYDRARAEGVLPTYRKGAEQLSAVAREPDDEDAEPGSIFDSRVPDSVQKEDL